MNANIESYVLNRIKKDSYRGVHLAQHNRLPEEKLVALLTAIYRAVGTDDFLVPPGDDPTPSRKHDPSRTRALPLYSQYYDILDEISRTNVDGISATFNSLKKNHFPNFVGMGLLQRDNAEKGNNDPIVARLTESAIKIINAGASRSRTVLIGKASEKLIGSQFIDEIHELLTRLDMLNVYEIMLIISDTDISTEQKESLVRSYRRLKNVSRIQLHETVKDQCLPTMSLSKKERRDWNNWWNEARQIITMLSTVSGFNVYNEEQIMLAGSSGVALFRPDRSTSIKRLALDWHGIPPKVGWELHHIYPVEYATCAKDMQMIDSIYNLLYIPADRHRMIPSRGNLSVRMRHDGNHIILENPVSSSGEPRIRFEISVDVAVNVDRIKKMVDYNDELLKAVS